MREFRELLSRILVEGEWRDNRTDQRARSVFGHYMRFDLQEGFPLVTEKAVPFKSVIAELVGFIRGYTSAEDFRRLGTNIWNDNANNPGTPLKPNSWLLSPWRKGEDDLGRIYGAQWRDWQGPEYLADAGLGNMVPQRIVVDQLARMIEGLMSDPFGRRHIVSAWNPGELHQMALPPCHVLFQCYVSESNYLDLQMYQRSADVFLGIPFNIASYAALLELIAAITGYTPRNLYMCLGDAHLYENAVDGAREVLRRETLPSPSLKVSVRDMGSVYATLNAVRVEDFELINYQHHPAIKVEMAV